MNKEELIAFQERDSEEKINEILNSSSSKNIIVAGPGTGKTYVFTLILERSNSKQNLVISFINRLINDLEYKLKDYAKVVTFHKFCIHIFYSQFPGWKIITCLNEIISSDLNIDKNAFDELFHKMKDSDKNFNAFMERSSYYKAAGFNDSIYRVLQKVLDNPEIISNFENILIDEFQDFTKSIKTITEMLTQLRKFGLHLTLISQTVSQITKSNYRDIIISNTNIKIIFGNIDKTLLAMNKTLNAKLKNVPKLPVGVAYLSVGNNEIIKVRNSDKLLIAKKNISEEKLNEIIEYQLDNYYRDITQVKNMDFSEEELKHKIDEFIIAIKSKNISYFAKIKEIDSKKYEELIYNFNDGMGYIAREELGFYFDSICSSNYFRNNNSVLLNIIKKDKFFEQKVDKNKTYNGKKRYILTQE